MSLNSTKLIQILPLMLCKHLIIMILFSGEIKMTQISQELPDGAICENSFQDFIEQATEIPGCYEFTA